MNDIERAEKNLEECQEAVDKIKSARRVTEADQENSEQRLAELKESFR